jgi:hypothetical protein
MVNFTNTLNLSTHNGIDSYNFNLKNRQQIEFRQGNWRISFRRVPASIKVTQPSIQTVQKDISPGVNRLGSEADHSLVPRLRMNGAITPLP